MLKKTVFAFCVFAICSGCFADNIRSISCSDTKIKLNCQSSGSFELIELRPYERYDANKKYPAITTGRSSQRVIIDRFVEGRDRLYSKFGLVDKTTGKVSEDFKYVTRIMRPLNGRLKLPRPGNIKGLSCIIDIDDAVKLGVKYVHENVHINQIVAIGNTKAEAFYEFEGLKIPLNMAAVRGLDARMKRFTDAGISVFMVLLNGIPSNPQARTALVHPNSDVANSPNHLGAFNITDEVGLGYYLGILEFLAKRYTRADKKYGLLSSIIVGNEVQSHWTWHNMGDVSEDDFIREYETSLRLAWLACGKFNGDLRVYVSMTHHWTKRGFHNNPLREIPGDVLLEKIAALSKAGGDYSWNVAFHPYPENLFEPRFWLDKSVTEDFSTPLITFKNIEVLPRFMKQDKMLCRRKIRDIALTEQGFNTPKGPDGEKIQAACYAYAYYKIKQIPEISAFILHRHVDHKAEGELKLGLWNNNPDSKDLHLPWKKKFIWGVFKYADSDRWEAEFKFAKDIIGIKQWGQKP